MLVQQAAWLSGVFVSVFGLFGVAQSVATADVLTYCW